MAVRTRVPESSRAAPSRVKGWERHLEGWQAGALAVFIAGTGAVLGVPRSVPPSEVPVPAVEPAALAAALATDTARARDAAAKAAKGELDYDVRALGEAVRAFGRAEVAERGADKEEAHRRATMAARSAIAHGPDAVLALRAFQARAFLREMRGFERTGEPTEELSELAGVFPRSVAAYRWYDPAARRLLPGDAALLALYKKRWNEVTGLKGEVFALSLDEERALLGFLLEHPAVAVAPLAASASPTAAKAHAVAAAVAADERRIEKIRDLARLDATYPAAFAEGVVLFRLGRFEGAAVAFERHLAAHPDGPWTLRARNHLKAALESR